MIQLLDDFADATERGLDRVRHAAPAGRGVGPAALLHPARHLALSRPLEDPVARGRARQARRPADHAARWRAGRWRCCTGSNCRSIRSRPARAIAAVDGLPLEQKLARLRDPALRARLLAEEPVYRNPQMLAFMRSVANMFVLGDPPNYTPPADSRLDARAAKLGVTPLELAYDLLVSGDGRTILFHPGANYTDCSDANMASMLRHDHTVMALGDGGAHYGMICDASYTTHALTYWTRDRQGERWPLAWAVQQLTDVPARMVGLGDRGRLAAGYKADLNVIDLDRLASRHRIPCTTCRAAAGGSSRRPRAIAPPSCGGEVTYRDGTFTGALPGRLVRGARLSGGRSTG